MAGNGGGLPQEIERKYLILRPTEEELSEIGRNNGGIQRTDIVQTYLYVPQNGTRRRVRKRGIEPDWTYTYTEKTDVSFGVRTEMEREITREEYEELLAESSPDRPPVIKTRYVFVFRGQTFELDVYDFSDEYATLEIELDDIGQPVLLPEGVTVVRDVTGEKRYNNSELAKSRSLKP